MSETQKNSPDSQQPPPNLREALRDCLLGGNGTGVCTRLPISTRVDELCDFFEEDWVAGGVPSIEEYLGRVPAAEQPGLLCELVRLDADYRRQRGELPSAAEYLVRFPEHASHLEPALNSDSELWVSDSVTPDGQSVRRSNKVTAETRDTRLADQATLHACPDALRSIGHFAILDPIGEGGFGSVWKARDPRLERIVAIKVPRKDQLSEIELERFLNEARSAASLRHPHIVAVHEVSRDQDVPYIVTEYVDGVSLREWLSFRKMTISEAVLLCAKLARALEHAHDHRIVHRDIKPENILVDARMEPHLADFGLAKHDRGPVATVDGSFETEADAETIDSRSTEAPRKHPTLGIREGSIFGTAAYMSPEQARGEGVHATPASDIYSLGVVLYELVAGRIPFRGATLRVLLHQVQFEDPPAPSQFNSSVPSELEAICLKALSKQPEARYATAGEFAQELERFLHQKPLEANPTSRLQQAWAWGCRHWLATGSVMLGSLAAAVFAFVFMLSASPPPIKGARVMIRTEPEGARVALIPLREEDASPDPSRMLRPSQTTPFEIDLEAGDYLIVAEVENHGFHEVHRHVPASRAEQAGFLLHRYFKWTDRGTIQWHAIKIPDHSVIDGMALVPSSSQPLGKSIEGLAPSHLPFYLDTTEFTIGDYRRLHHGKLPIELRDSSPDDQMPLTSVRFDDAVALAEAAGKRLPDAAELAQASTGGGTRRYPWGDVWDPRVTRPLSPGVVGTPEFDRMTVAKPAIAGLASNVFEWTSTGVANPSGWLSRDRDRNGWRPVSHRRVVWQGGVKFVGGNLQPIDPQRDRIIQFTEDEQTRKSTVGFRCARSQRPRLKPADFPIQTRDPTATFSDSALAKPVVLTSNESSR